MLRVSLADFQQHLKCPEIKKYEKITEYVFALVAEYVFANAYFELRVQTPGINTVVSKL